MEVGEVVFYNQEVYPYKLSSLFITNVTGQKYHNIPADWPQHKELVKRTKTFFFKSYRHCLCLSYIAPLSISQPIVEEISGDIHQRQQPLPGSIPIPMKP